MSIVRRKTKNRGTVYDVRLRDASGKVYTRTFNTKKEAGRYEAMQLADRARGAWIDPRKASDRLAEVAAEWLASNPQKKGSSIARDTSIVTNHVIPMLGSYAVGQITPADVQRLVNDWSTKLGARTVRRQYAVLSAIMTFALDSDRILRSPCRRIRLPEPESVTHTILGPEDLHRLAAAAGPDTSAMVYLAALLGLRWGECAGLRVGGIGFSTRVVSVETQLTRGIGGRMVTGAPKWNSGRTMAAPDGLLELLDSHLVRRGIPRSSTNELVFVSADGEALHYSNWRRRVWVPACQQVGLEGFQFKMLRTTNATMMVALAIDVKTVQTRVGHRRATTTLDVYAQPTPAADRSAADVVGTYFMGDPKESAPDSDREAVARDKRAMEPSDAAILPLRRAPSKEPVTSEDEESGGSKNRTCDLSIISAAL
jgi:integrase